VCCLRKQKQSINSLTRSQKISQERSDSCDLQQQIGRKATKRRERSQTKEEKGQVRDARVLRVHSSLWLGPKQLPDVQGPASRIHLERFWLACLFVLVVCAIANRPAWLPTILAMILKLRCCKRKQRSLRARVSWFSHGLLLFLVSSLVL
jgi:hypothetical protein